MEPMTGGARIALLVVIALLLVTLGFLLALALLARRRDAPVASDGTLRQAVADDEADVAGERIDELAGLKACPTCGVEYAAGLSFCPRDARRLVDADEVDERARLSGRVCPRCRRGFEPGARRCVDDGTELVSAAMAASFALTAQGEGDGGDGAPGKICPRCKIRQADGASFCGHDGARLVALN